MNWKSIGLHAALVLVAWLLGDAIFGTAVIYIAPDSALHNFPMFQKLQTGYGAFGIWVVYRLGASLLRFPPPQGAMFYLVRLTWCFFAYAIVGGTIETMIGHPTPMAGLAGIPLAVVVFFLPRPKPKAEAPVAFADTSQYPGEGH